MQLLEKELLKLKLDKQKVEINKNGTLEQNGDSNVEDTKLLGFLVAVEKFEKELASRKKLWKNYEELLMELNQLTTKMTQLQQSLKDHMLPFMEEYQCSVCREYLVKPTVLNCSHWFCNMCILRWRKENNNCPLCRTPISAIVEWKKLDEIIEKTLFYINPNEREERLQLRQSYEASTAELCSSSGSSRHID